MAEQNDASAGDKGEQIDQVVTNAHSEHMIPKSRFDALNEKKKAAELSLEEIADGFVETIPEDMRELVPNLSPAEKIKWIQAAQKQGLFVKKSENSGLDSKKPGDKAPTDFKDMSPQAIMSQGYKTN
jgi:hypothetical protein